MGGNSLKYKKKRLDGTSISRKEDHCAEERKHITESETV